MRLLLELAIVCMALGVGQSACPHDAPDLTNWDDTSTWPSSTVPVADQNVTIEKGMKVRLNTSPPCLSTIVIEEEASLVWGDVDGITLCVSYILIKGTFQIGNEECRFTKKANIHLIGESNSSLFDPDYGRKFIGVAEGGTIEIHGEEKPTWVKLIQTLPAARDTCGNVFSFKTQPFSSEVARGLYVSVFNNDGSLYDFGIYRTGDGVAGEDVKFQNFLESIPTDKVVAIALQGDLGTGDWSAIYTALETIGGLPPGSSDIRSVSGREAYAFITRKGHSDTTIEKHVANPRGVHSVETDYLVLNYNGLQFRVNSKVYQKTKLRRGVDFEVLTEEVASPCVRVNADVSKWRAGDKVVVGSTDFDWKQAEEMTISASQSRDPNELCFTKPFKYMHYGEVTLGVDERAEIGLLSRNIVIQGIIQEAGCTANDDEDKVLCDRFGYDTFGGQLKILRGFKAAHIQGVELFHMGQQKHVGTYPLHFHMCDDVTGNWFRHNSIHNTTRCVVIHGTDHAEVSHNFCYRNLGHAIFLEDSAEIGNVIDSNLVMSTMHGSHILTDMRRDWCEPELKEACDALSSFWITHPDNTFINNVAAGGENVGYWILAARRPLGPSKVRQEKRGLVKEFYAMQTKMKKFFNNTVHSYKRGVRLDGIISINQTKDGKIIPENGIILPGVSHSPRVTPGNKKSAFDISVFESTTIYKSKDMNIWSKAGIVVFKNFTLADATKGIIMASGKGGVFAEITGSLLVGETENTGLPMTPFDRSRPNQPDEPVQGVLFYQGPGVVSHSFFNKYETKQYQKKKNNGELVTVTRYAGAISVKRSNPYPPKANSQVEGIKFGYCDKEDTKWVFNGAPDKPFFANKDGNRQITFWDVDGSVSGTPNTQFVPNTAFHTTPRCDYREHANFAVCPYNYAKLIFKGNDGVLDRVVDQKYPVYIRRDDRPNDPFSITGEKGVNYLVIKGKSYRAYFNGTAPTKLSVSAQNLERGDYIRVGICYPKDVTGFTFAGGYANMRPRNPAIPANTITELDDDLTGRAYFHDKTSGLLFIKLNSTTVRQSHEVCPDFQCPTLSITRIGGSDTMPECDDDTYNKPADSTVGKPTASGTCDKTTSDGFGAEVEDFVFTAPEFSPTCPKRTTTPDRGSIVYEGCYKDSFVRDVPHDLIKLPMSMTKEFCIERCYIRNYAYAALQNGNECRCGNLFNAYGTSTDCNKKCTGKKKEICGGMMANDVYATGNKALPALAPCRTDKKGAMIDGKCYYLTPSIHSYVNAERECMKLGGNLATINSKEVQFAVERYMRPQMVNAWIGLNDIITEGAYQFMDKTTPSGYYNFMTAQGSSSGEDGVVIVADRLYQWNDRNIRERYRALCQLDGSSPAPTKCGHNNNGQQLDGGACYTVLDKKLPNYREAVYACYTRRGVVADASDPGALAEIRKHVLLHGTTATETDYWVAKEGGYKKLRHSLLYSKVASKFGHRNGVVCKIETLAPNSCSTGWIYNNKQCYLFTGARQGYDGYKRLCSQDDSTVLTIEDESENMFVADATKSVGIVYLGYVFNNDTRTFGWDDGSTYTYDNWQGGQGVTNTAGGWCAVLRTNNKLWRNRKCTFGAPIVCKAPAGQQKMTP